LIEHFLGPELQLLADEAMCNQNLAKEAKQVFGDKQYKSDLFFLNCGSKRNSQSNSGCV